jgi:hypothetical protein
VSRYPLPLFQNSKKPPDAALQSRIVVPEVGNHVPHLVDVWMLQHGEDLLVAERLRQVLASAV